MITKLLLRGSLLLILSLGISTNSFANTISGTISLPDGIVAGNGGATIELRGLFVEVFTGRDTVVIPQGSSSANYTLEFSGGYDQEIMFECASGCFQLGVTTEGTWSEEDGVVSSFLGTEYLASSDHIVNILMEAATLFSGKIQFPDGFIATGEEFVIGRVSSNDQFSFSRFLFASSLSPGQTELDFEIGVPNSATNSSWELKVSCTFDCIETIPDDDNYATTITGNPLSLNEDDAFEYPNIGTYFNLVLTLNGSTPEPNDSIIITPILFLLDSE